MTKMQLRREYVQEANCHRAIVGRCNSGRYVLDPEFRDFGRFLWHLGPRPAPDWSVDRISPANLTYGPGLCRWASPRQQANNRGITVHLTAGGEIRPLTHWAQLTGQNPKTIAKRLDRGWTHEEAIAGRRGGNVDPEPLQTPAAAPMLCAEGWPAGLAESKIAIWEAGFQAFASFARRMFRRSEPLRLTRAAFFVWIAENAVRSARERLAARYPGYGDPEADHDDLDWPTIQADPDSAQLRKAEPLLRAARGEVWATDPCDEVVNALRRMLPRIDAPDSTRLGRLRWRDPEDE